MSSNTQAELAQKLDNYTCLIIVVAITYDYCLTFSREITYIWKRPWTWVSTLFLIIRYVGYPSAISFAFFGTTFVPGPVKYPGLIRIRGGNIFYLINNWAYTVFWAAADVVMILRVYAMYHRSRLVLGCLLVSYVIEMVLFFVSSGIISSPKYAIVSTTRSALDTAVCNVTFITQIWNIVPTIFQLILDAAMCILVIAQFVRESLRMYQATGRWQPNRYLGLLARDVILYFFATFLNGLITMVDVMGIIPSGWPTVVLYIAANVPIYTLVPRFVMDVRELYERDTRGRRERDIDSGFGLSNGAWRSVEESMTMRTMSFGGAPWTQRSDYDEETTITKEEADTRNDGLA